MALPSNPEALRFNYNNSQNGVGYYQTLPKVVNVISEEKEKSDPETQIYPIEISSAWGKLLSQIWGVSPWNETVFCSTCFDKDDFDAPSLPIEDMSPAIQKTYDEIYGTEVDPRFVFNGLTRTQQNLVCMQPESKDHKISLYWNKDRTAKYINETLNRPGNEIVFVINQNPNIPSYLKVMGWYMAYTTTYQDILHKIREEEINAVDDDYENSLKVQYIDTIGYNFLAESKLGYLRSTSQLLLGAVLPNMQQRLQNGEIYITRTHDKAKNVLRFSKHFFDIDRLGTAKGTHDRGYYKLTPNKTLSTY